MLRAGGGGPWAGAALRTGSVLLGLWVGVLGALVHRMSATAVGVDWPWGLVLALGTTGAVAAACGRLVRMGAAWFGAGWTVALLLQQVWAPQRYLVAGDAVGWSFMILGLGGVAALVVRASRLER